MKRKISPVVVAGVLIVLVGVALGVYTTRDQQPQTARPIYERSNSTKHNAARFPYVEKKLSQMSLRQKVTSLLILHRPGTGKSTLSSYLANYQPGGLILMGDNIPNTLSQLKAQNQALVSDQRLPEFIAIDEEGDTVRRLAADDFPGPLSLRNQKPEETKKAFAQRSQLLHGVGVNLNFGIIADVTSDPNSFIYPRVLGTTPEAASQRVAQAVAGSRGKTLTTLKHFPGHGETTADSHTTIPTATTGFEDWENRVALPFKSGIEAGADVVMFGHLRYIDIDSHPATLSKKWHSIIRDDLGFKGLTITDDMIMLQNSGESAYANPVANAVLALQAGNDLLLYVLDHEDTSSYIDPNSLINGIVKAVKDGRINAKSIDDRAKKILSVRHGLND